jgi:endonuclease/exonuclease/phosphatase family metal-dependent hydrolase
MRKEFKQSAVRHALRIVSLVALCLVATGLGRVLGRPRATESAPAPPGAFTSLAACRSLLGAGQRLERPAGVARFASWNLRWFPDGAPGTGSGRTDPSWLACALAWLDADVIAVQEIKQTPDAERALAGLLVELNRLSKGRYVARLDDCGNRVQQHVGVLWNEARVSAGGFETVAALNPLGSACQDQLRPGLAARLRLPGGLDLTVVSAHFKSKSDERAFGLRRRSFQAIPGVMAELGARSGDADVLLLGDLNTMGCERCSPQVSALAEQAEARRQLAVAGLSLLTADAPGSELYGGHSTLLDHAVTSRAMRELPAAARVHVSGVCGGSAAKGRAAEPARRALSDHCPIVLDLTDRDLD